ncbi:MULTISPECIES: GNAT family N-acetyltransferase [Cytobacillus]|uniref:GNAT family N-acetyltransferase n=1 Tax=Cytobacillus stercorigallinarum TaxID=2762240 RepID=A0ABR8QQJ2_9BACI|nr:GNAT family N-acetyltransferase [Cytobacillus stercorigallinarum]MBD7937811.1 GNAT family N-acetyltransferase [Cytobacillus stercorigallinarum]
MGYEYIVYNTTPEAKVLNDILKLHKDIFGTSDSLISHMQRQSKLLVIIAKDGEKTIGYKIGYAIDRTKFYSWLGGIDFNYRKQGIASMLMKKQHQYLRNNGFHIVQTKTMYKWRNMLILNIKSGFDIIHTYTNEKGLHKIILEKNLLNN